MECPFESVEMESKGKVDTNGLSTKCCEKSDFSTCYWIISLLACVCVRVEEIARVTRVSE